MRQKMKKVLNTHALGAIWKWSKSAHGPILLICAMGILTSLLSLGMTLVTKNLIDSATSREWEQLVRYGVQIVLIIMLERVLGVLNSYIQIRTSARLQLELQRMVTRKLLFKEYTGIKPFHSGELTNRVFSDVAVVKSGIMSILPSLLRTAVSFIGAAIILISMDWRFIPVMMICAVVGSVLSFAFR